MAVLSCSVAPSRLISIVILAIPCILGRAFNIKATNMNMIYSKIANMAGIPALTIPNSENAKTIEQTGLMIHGKWWDDTRVLAFGQVLQNG